MHWKLDFTENYPGGSVKKSPYLVINTGNEWKKMYINLTPHMAQMVSANSFKIYFQTALKEGYTEGKIFP